MDLTGPHVRRARPADAEGVARVHVDSWRAAYDGLVPAALLDGLDVGERTASWRHHLDEATATGRTSVAVREEAAGEVLGFVSVGPSRDDDADPGTAELWALYAHPEVWGGGVGAALHDSGLDELSRTGSSHATLWVLEANARAISFYERRGWRADGARRIERRDGADLEEARYRRVL